MRDKSTKSPLLYIPSVFLVANSCEKSFICLFEPMEIKGPPTCQHQSSGIVSESDSSIRINRSILPFSCGDFMIFKDAREVQFREFSPFFAG
jgi:hypothetical protein